MKPTFLAVCFTGLLLLGVLFLSFDPERPPYALTRIDIADSAPEREQGLSGLAVPEDYGMLFVFPSPGQYGFWMKDMLVPLDILWLSKDGTIVGMEKNVPPESYPKTFFPLVPVAHVLEVRGGTAAARGWQVGDRLELPIP